MIGTTVGSYRILSKLGEGGMGAVYAAEHALLGRRAAIKVLLPELSKRPAVVERFFNEARASTAIGDLGVVQVFDFGYHVDGSAFIVMELLEGESLDARLRRVGALPVRDALRIIRQMAQTLATVHARGVIHRDLKPDNVFLVPDGEAEGGERPKILDFGIAKLTDGDGVSVSQTRTGALMGTPLYMSPEQCRGGGHIDHRSDVYALGCVLFRLLCGRPPFEGVGPGDVMIKHVTEPPPPPSWVRAGVPAAVDALVLRCLAKAPGERFEDMTAVARAAAGVQAQLTGGGLDLPDSAPGPLDWRRQTPAPPTPTTLSAGNGATATVPPPRRSRGLVVIGMVAAAAIVVGGGVWLGQRARPDPAAAPAVAGGEPDARARADATPDPAPIATTDAVDAGHASHAPDASPAIDAPAAVDAPDAGAASKPEPTPRKRRRPKPVEEDPYALPSP